MGEISYIVMALGVLDLLLAASCLLMVFFDWTAARRREFLYLFFSEEKPGINYFAAARRRRAQYTRLLTAFLVLFARELLAAILLSSVCKPVDWQAWVRWWTDGKLDPAVALAAELQVWVGCLGLLGLGLLGFALLYEFHQKHAALIDGLCAVYTLAAIAFTVGLVEQLFGAKTQFVERYAILATLVVLVTGFVYGLLTDRRGDGAGSEAAAERVLLSLGLISWLLGQGVGACIENPALGPFGQAIGYSFITLVIARRVLLEYETMESSRHRLGRERTVIFSFLQRIGAAFTKALDLEQVLHMILETALESTEALAGAIYLYHAETRQLEPRVVLNFFPPLYVDTPAALSPQRTEALGEEMKHQSFGLSEGVIGEVAQSGLAKIVDDVKASGVMLGTTTDFMRNRSMLVVPLRLREEPLGVMAVLNKQRGSFNHDDQSLLQALADQGALSINNAMLTSEVGRQAQLRRELQIAREIQQRLLPDKCPVVPGFAIAARGTSATEVGGDYYDFFWVDEGRLGIVVADVSGKGVHAALVVAMIRSAFRTQARGNPDVRAVLNGVNGFISEDLPQNMFITCIYGMLEVATRRFIWGRAGHEPLIVAHRDAATDVLSPSGFALGVIDSPEFAETLEVDTVEMRPGDRVLIFTDGLTEAMNSHGEEFGMERILHIMDEHQFHGPGSGGVAISTSGHGGHGTATVTRPDRTTGCDSVPDEYEPDDLISIDLAVEEHVGDAPQSDDLTIVYIEAT